MHTIDILLQNYPPRKLSYRSLYENLTGVPKVRSGYGSYNSCFFLAAQQDSEGNYAIHLAVMCNGMDTDFERTVNILDTIR